MPIRYTVEGRFTREFWSGPVTIDEVREHWRTMVADPRTARAKRNLADVRELEVRFTSDELRRAVGEILLPVAARYAGLRTAILVGSEVNFGVSRQYEVFAEAFGEDRYTFTDEAEAHAWLAGTATPAEDPHA